MERFRKLFRIVLILLFLCGIFYFTTCDIVHPEIDQDKYYIIEYDTTFVEVKDTLIFVF